MRFLHPGFIIVPPGIPTWNQTDKSSNIVLTGGLLTATANSAADGAVRATRVRNSGKYYVELSFPAITGGDTGGGLANSTATLASIGVTVANATMQFKSGSVYNNTALQFNNGNMTAGGILRVAYDAGAHRAWFSFAGGNWNANAAFDPGAGSGGLDVSAFDSGGLFPCFCAGGNADACTANFGVTSFSYTVPSGFTAWKG